MDFKYDVLALRASYEGDNHTKLTDHSLMDSCEQVNIL